MTPTSIHNEYTRELYATIKRPVVKRLSELIGNTPLFELVTTGSGSRILLKLEMLNPTGSAKVRMARSMIDAAETNNQLRPGDTIIEPTSGNTGAGLALLARERGYTFQAVVDPHACHEKLAHMQAIGTELVTVPANPDGGPSTIVRRAVAEEKSREQCFWPDQHNNPDNADGYFGLGAELYRDLDGKIDTLVAAIGTGGTLSGTTQSLHDLGVHPHIIAVEPAGSIIFGKTPHPYYQTGSGSPAGFPVGTNVRYDLIDNHMQVNDVWAFATARVLAHKTGLLVGGSTGGALCVALHQLLYEKPGSNIVVIAADAGEKYLDTIFNTEWLKHKNLYSQTVEKNIHRLFHSYEQSCLMSKKPTPTPYRSAAQ